MSKHKLTRKELKYKQGFKDAIEIIDNKLKNSKRFAGNKSILKELKKEFEEKVK